MKSGVQALSIRSQGPERTQQRETIPCTEDRINVSGDKATQAILSKLWKTQEKNSKTDLQIIRPSGCCRF